MTHNKLKVDLLISESNIQNDVLYGLTWYTVYGCEVKSYQEKLYQTISRWKERDFGKCFVVHL